MHDPLKTKTFKVGADVAAYRIVKFDSDDDTVIQAAAVTDAGFGISNNLGADYSDAERLDVHVAGIAEVEYGGAVTRGALLTSDADGKAVTAAPAAGVNNRIIGTAMKSGVSGDIGSCQIAPGMMQGQ